jgi:hypothetical protein
MSAWVLILMFANTQSMTSVVIDVPTEAVCRRELRLRVEARPSNGFVQGICLNRSP